MAAATTAVVASLEEVDHQHQVEAVPVARDPPKEQLKCDSACSLHHL